MRELLIALRQLTRSPGYTIVAVLTVALSIGASTAVFTVLDRVLLQPLTFPQSGQLITIWEDWSGVISHVGPNPRHADLWRKRSKLIEDMALVDQRTAGLSLDRDRPRPVTFLRASTNLLTVLRVHPALGRDLRPEESLPGRDSVALISDRLWRALFSGDRNVNGKTVYLAGRPIIVVGVLPASFHFPKASVLRAFPAAQLNGVAEADMLVPDAERLDAFSWNGDYGNHLGIARLKPNVTLRQAQIEFDNLERGVLESIRDNEKAHGDIRLTARIEPLHEAVVTESSRALWLLTAAVSSLLLIACLNLANAQLSRALLRERESAVRSSLGAGAFRLLWSGLAESILLACAGGFGGLLLAETTLDLFRFYAPVDVPRLAEIQPDLGVFLFAVLVTCGSALLFGALPALHTLQTDPQRALTRSGVRVGQSSRTARLRQALITAQVVGCTALLVLTTLFAESLQRLSSNGNVFEAGRIAVAEVDLSPAAFQTRESKLALQRGILDRLRRLPMVQSSGVISAMPLGGDTWIDSLEPVDKHDGDGPLANLRWASPGALQALGFRLIEGQYLEERDGEAHNAVISAAAARAAWPNRDALGRQFRNNGARLTVIGIVADLPINSLKTAPPVTVYAPYQDDRSTKSYFVIRSRSESDASLLNQMRKAIWSYNSQASIMRLKTLDAQLADSLSTERFETAILAFFGTSALLLAALGIFGVLSYAVNARRREFGVRIALGATGTSIYRLTVSQALLPVLLGLAGGLALSQMLVRYIQSLLYGVSGIHADTCAFATAILLFAAALAAYLPSRRAARIDPAEALRAE